MLPMRIRSDMNDEAKECEEAGEMARIVENYRACKAGGSKGGAFMSERRIGVKREEVQAVEEERNHSS